MDTSRKAKTQEEMKVALKHRDALLNVRSILKTNAGHDFFKYLFDVFDVTGLPEVGLEGPLMFEQMGFLRAGKSIFKLVSEADVFTAAKLLAQAEKDRYDELVKDFENGQG